MEPLSAPNNICKHLHPQVESGTVPGSLIFKERIEVSWTLLQGIFESFVNWTTENPHCLLYHFLSVPWASARTLDDLGLCVDRDWCSCSNSSYQ
jgi:hypothetical protein